MMTVNRLAGLALPLLTVAGASGCLSTVATPTPPPGPSVASAAAAPFQWKDEATELRYLRALSNPTPEQWTRKEALMGKPAVVKQADAFQAEAALMDRK